MSEATKEESDEYLNNRNIKDQDIIKTNPKLKLIINKMPK